MWFLIEKTFQFLAALAGYYTGVNVWMSNSKSNDNLEIFGGQPIKITEAPFMARLAEAKSGDFFCGASVIDKRFVLSAEHCSEDMDGHSVVIVGSDRLNDTQNKYEIQKIFRDPDNDILVIKLSKELTFSDRVQPIKLADANLILKEGDVLGSIGFGLTENSEPSPILLKVDLPFMDHKKCYEILQAASTEICAGGVDGKDTCSGDSGGPLKYKDTLVGAVSWGMRQCGTAGIPGVYASIANSRRFIDKVMQENDQ